jgi:serine/threonine-protein phosphatase 2A activator
VPCRAIGTEEDLYEWLDSPACASLIGFVDALADALVGVETGKPPVEPAGGVAALALKLQALNALADAHPAQRGAPTTGVGVSIRYGDLAFRDWHDAMSATAVADMTAVLEAAGAADAAGAGEELARYWVDAFGSRARLDYGTGHEAAFAMALLVASTRGSLLGPPGDDGARDARAAVAATVLPSYFALCQRLVAQYRLEPAGSHGVWCVDDYALLPFFFGAAQLESVGGGLRPRAALDGEVSACYRQRYLIFEQACHLRETKAAHAAFEEACPILTDVLRLAKSWAVARRGLLQLWKCEVLGKFPVAQHFLFGATLAFQPSAERAVGAAPAPDASPLADRLPIAAVASPRAQRSAIDEIDEAVIAVWPAQPPHAHAAAGGASAHAHVSIVTLVQQLFGGAPGSAAASAAVRVRAGGGGAPGSAAAERWAAIDAEAAQLQRRGAGAAGTEGAPLPDAPPLAVASAVAAAAIPSASGAGAGAPHAAAPDGEGGVRLRRWHVHSAHRPLANAAELAALGAALGERFAPPEMAFLKSHLTLRFEPAVGRLDAEGATPGARPLVIRLCALDALRGCVLRGGARAQPDGRAPAPALLRLPDSARWEARLAALAAALPHVEIAPAVGADQSSSDWTFATTYRGTFTRAAAPTSTASGSVATAALDGCQSDSAAVEPAAAGREVAVEPVASVREIDYELLKRRDPILWSDEVCLFESELDDNGVASLTARVRVMEGAWFVLMRYWLRLDGVLVRAHETRLFHRFGEPLVLVEYTAREDTFAALAARGLPTEPRAYFDPNAVVHTLTLTHKFVDEVPVLG